MLAGDGRRRLGRWLRMRARSLQNRKYFLFNRQLARIRKLEPIAGENFDSVVSPWIVRCGNDHARVEFLRTRKVSHSRSGNNPGAANFHLARRKAKGNAISDPAAGFARILPDHNARLRLGLDQIMPEGASDQKSALGGEREFSSHAANPVGPEKLSSLRGHCDWDGGDRAGTRSIIIVIVTGCGSTT